MDIVVINLDKSKDRLETMQKQFDTLNLPFTRFPAIYGKNLEKHMLKNKTSFICRDLLCNYGMIGCFLSHMEINKKFLNETNHPFVCVMEDDIKLSPQFPTFLNDIQTIFDQTNFDILSLFCIGVCQSIKEKINILNYTLTKPLFPLSASCYILSRKGAERIQKLIGEKILYHIDFSIAFSRLFSNLDYFVLSQPKLVEIQNGDSTMGTNSKSVVINVLKKCKAERAIWFLNVPVCSVHLKYTLSLYFCILLLLFLFSLYKKFKILACLFLLEMILLLRHNQNQ